MYDACGGGGVLRRSLADASGESTPKNVFQAAEARTDTHLTTLSRPAHTTYTGSDGL